MDTCQAARIQKTLKLVISQEESNFQEVPLIEILQDSSETKASQ